MNTIGNAFLLPGGSAAATLGLSVLVIAMVRPLPPLSWIRLLHRYASLNTTVVTNGQRAEAVVFESGGCVPGIGDVFASQTSAEDVP
ncbi:MAG: hypothetical protein ACYDBH_11245, partial [Acidobacteriaceae bacterium]